MLKFLSFRPFTGLHMLAIMLVFFGTVIAVNINMAVRANTSWTGLVAKNGYVASIDYQRDREGRKAAAALGWTVAVDETAGHVTFTVLSGEEEAPVYMSAVEALAVRSVTRDDPRPMVFESIGDGQYRNAEALPSGDWVLKASLRKSDTTVPWRAVISVE
jgi:nitrogen fixation protein FixH